MLKQDLIKQLLIVFIAVYSVLNQAQAEENDGPMIGNFVVDFSSKKPSSSWVAKAIELNAYEDISSFSRLVAIGKDNIDISDCPDLYCRLGRYQQNNVHLLVEGEIEGQSHEAGRGLYRLFSIGCLYF